MEGVSRSNSFDNCTIQDNSEYMVLEDSNLINVINRLLARHYAFSSVCDWNLILMRNNQQIHGQ
jgi:hypothetical protein